MQNNLNLMSRHLRLLNDTSMSVIVHSVSFLMRALRHELLLVQANHFEATEDETLDLNSFCVKYLILKSQLLKPQQIDFHFF